MSELEINLYDYIHDYMYIQTKNGELVPLTMNTAQNRFYDIFRDAYNEDRPCKIIVLKARQLGISTATEAIITSMCMTSEFKTSLIVAHQADSTNHIYNMAKRYYENLPPELKPMLKYSNAKELRFQNPNDKSENKGLRSSIRVATAGQGGVGRSQTFNYMHLSELAFWEEQDGQTIKDQMTGLLQCLPQHGFSFLVIESTANGYNYFKTLWDQAVNGESDYIPLFIPWFEMEEYRNEYNGEDFTEEEKALADKYNLDPEQLMWRRYAIRNLCGNDLDKFNQEYPSCPEDAFILSGTPFFNPKIILERMKDDLAPHYKGMFTQGGTFYEDTNGYVEIWEKPEFGHVYCIGADTAGEGSDWFVAYVLDKTQHGKMVAKYRAQTDEGLFVQQYMALGYYYNYAMLAPETNFSSFVTAKLQELNYLNMYVREQVDTYSYKTSKKFGFRTTSLTRPLILDQLKDIVREHIDLIMDQTFFQEALSFVKNDRGKPEASSGAHDDCVMALAIAFFALPQAQMQYVAETDDLDGFDDPTDFDFINFGV